ESVAGTNAFGVFGLKRTGLVPAPCQTGILGQGGLVVKTFDVANLSENAGRVNLVDAGDGAKAPGAVHAVQDPLDGFVQLLELSLDATDRLDGDAQHKIDGVFHDLGQPVRVSGGLLDAAGDTPRVGEAVLPFLLEIVGQIRHVHRGDVIEAVLFR